VPVEPVKWMPARSGCGSATSETAVPPPVTMLMTPGGIPAASSRRIVRCADSCWVGEGFQTTVLPMSAGASGRFAAMAVKLNGVMASTKPSSGRWSIRFHTPAELIGCWSSTWRPKATLKRRKSMSSQAASISAWKAVLLWPSMVAALSRSRHGPASSSAARSSTPARSSNDSARQEGAAARAASTAACTSAEVASRVVPRTAACRCGWTTSIGAPPPARCSPSIVMVRSSGVAASSLTALSRQARSALPGA
jgi:hypothetical protein